MFGKYKFLYILMLTLSLLMIITTASASDIDQQATDDTVLSANTDVAESSPVNKNNNLTH